MSGPDLPDWLRPLVAAADGLDGTALSRFLPPDDGSGRPSAVLAAFGDGPDGPSVLLIERAATLRLHAGQVAFPGGSVDRTDDGPVAAALREAHEETGLDPAEVDVVAVLPAVFIPVSGFVVTPVVGWWRTPTEAPGNGTAAVDEAEVARVVLVPLAELTDPANRFTVTHPSGFLGPGFAVRGLFVWGFTGGLLDRMLHLGGWSRPWDRTVRRAVPAL